MTPCKVFRCKLKLFAPRFFFPFSAFHCRRISMCAFVLFSFLPCFFFSSFRRMVYEAHLLLFS